jgi:hypothetical protein
VDCQTQQRRKPKKVNKMDMQEFSGSSFFKADELKDQPPVQLRIFIVEIGKYNRPNITFESGRKFSVNTTNNKTLVEAYGRDSDNWIGHVIELFVVDGVFEGEPQKQIKVRPISKSEHYGEANKQPGPVRQKPVPPPAPKSLDNMDEIPF